MLHVGGGELLLILLIAFLVVGPGDLPKLARKMGGMVRTVRDVISEAGKELEDDQDTGNDLR